jgi:hypothetical protein
MKYLVALLLVFSLSAQATPSLEEIATSPETFAVCKTVDIASTAYLLGHGFVESNPLVAWSMNIGGYVPLIAVSYGIYWAMKKFKDEPGAKTATAIANGATCFVAAQNLLLIP